MKLNQHHLNNDLFTQMLPKLNLQYYKWAFLFMLFLPLCSCLSSEKSSEDAMEIAQQNQRRGMVDFDDSYKEGGWEGGTRQDKPVYSEKPRSNTREAAPPEEEKTERRKLDNGSLLEDEDTEIRENNAIATKKSAMSEKRSVPKKRSVKDMGLLKILGAKKPKASFFSESKNVNVDDVMKKIQSKSSKQHVEVVAGEGMGAAGHVDKLQIPMGSLGGKQSSTSPLVTKEELEAQPASAPVDSFSQNTAVQNGFALTKDSAPVKPKKKVKILRLTIRTPLDFIKYSLVIVCGRIEKQMKRSGGK